MKNPHDERAVKSRRRILDATQALMIELGVDAVTILTVAERAGVQRSTVYNHWPDRVSLVVDALDDFAGSHHTAEGEDSGASPVVRIRAAVEGLARALAGDWGAIAASLASVAERDGDLARVHRDFVELRRTHVATLVGDAVAAGELSKVDPQWATALLVGPLYYERLVMHRPMTVAEACDHIDGVLTLLR